AALADERKRRRSVLSGVGAAGALGWLAGTLEFAWARVAPGPRTADEIRTMLLTSAVLPAAATYHTISGLLRLPPLLARGGPVPVVPQGIEPPAAVLFDRDGTLVEDVPYNGDPDRVVPRPGAKEALDRLRAAGVRLAVVSNQSGVGRGRRRPRRGRRPPAGVAVTAARPHVLVARLDSLGDVLLAGPAVRAVAAAAGRVTFLASRRGQAAAELLPGVDEVVVADV